MYTLARHKTNLFIKKNAKNNYLNQIKKFKYFTSSSTGRSLVHALINELNFNKNDKVLLPSYSPEGLIIPFKKNNINIVFYKLKTNLEPDIDFIKKKLLKSKNIRLFVKIHNMGFSKMETNLLEILKLNKIFILEDFAQSSIITIQNTNRHKYNKTFYLYSLNKILPVADGAFLTSYNRDIIDKINSNKRLKPNYKSINYYLKHIDYNNKIANSSCLSKSKIYLSKSNEYYEKYYKFIKNDFVLRDISLYSLKILEYIDMNNLLKQRVKNYNLLASLLNSKKFKLLYNTKSLTGPMALPLLIKGSRLKIYNKLFKNCILASVQKNKWNFNYIKLSKNIFKNEFKYIQNHLLITIDEECTNADMRYIAKVLNNI